VGNWPKRPIPHHATSSLRSTGLARTAVVAPPGSVVGGLDAGPGRNYTAVWSDQMSIWSERWPDISRVVARSIYHFRKIDGTLLNSPIQFDPRLGELRSANLVDCAG
jgi:hypothetical protein